MEPICATRVLKNAKHIQALAPDVFPATEPLEGFASIVPFDILRRFHRMSEAELASQPKLAQAWRELHDRPVLAQRLNPHGLIFSDDPFNGTLYLAKLSFQVGAKTVSIPDADMATMLQYLTVAAPAISGYCSQYGHNRLAVSSKILTMTVDVPAGKYNDDTLQDWVKALLAQVDTPVGNSCVIVCNPAGVANTDGDSAKGVLGYHDRVSTLTGTWPDQRSILVPYCFINVRGEQLLVDDQRDLFADVLSHEVAEMTVDPYTSWTNPEVCDGCAGNCGHIWRSYFALDAAKGYTYLRSARGTHAPPGLRYDFFTAAVAQPSRSDDCPAPDGACAYAPSVHAGIGELLFYEKPNGYAELFAVDAGASIALQTVYPDWRNSWSLIVPGRYTNKSSGRRDLLFYDAGSNTGEFYQTGSVGDMHQISSQTNWRNSWSIIVHGSFATPSSLDLLFYEAGHGVGEFYRTDGHANLTLIRAYTTFRTTWSIILSGAFSDSGYSDLLFYDPASGTGEFYSTDGHGNLALIANHSNWRTTWSIILVGKFTNSKYSDLLFYDPVAGDGEFYSTDGRGNLTLIGAHSNWRTTWSSIVTGKFSDSPYSDLLFYDPAGGTGEFYRTDGRGNIKSIQNHTNWRTTWTMVLSL
jgi:hypothetical protein